MISNRPFLIFPFVKRIFHTDNVSKAGKFKVFGFGHSLPVK